MAWNTRIMKDTPMTGLPFYQQFNWLMTEVNTGLFIDLPSIPEYWITARLNTEFKGHAIIWYTEMNEIHGRRNWPWWKAQIIQKYRNGTWIWKNTISFDDDNYSVDKDSK
ncbi:hypothetical protein O181_049634 [Austropuccinia psidii MF-1]|uniref:Uncharacterized protein n=1 Tax=Austropuccinia psidii MF-1 TaxID=1389203 RepID=A0A9Q3HNY4_9BASI|nr:hypothetical protein [Austropuccinia psidii MF-1]